MDLPEIILNDESARVTWLKVEVGKLKLSCLNTLRVISQKPDYVPLIIYYRIKWGSCMWKHFVSRISSFFCWFIFGSFFGPVSFFLLLWFPVSYKYFLPSKSSCCWKLVPCVLCWTCIFISDIILAQSILYPRVTVRNIYCSHCSWYLHVLSSELEVKLSVHLG